MIDAQITRRRPRLSVLTLLLLVTIAALGITVAMLWRDVEPLRAELRDLRNEVGQLSIDDPALLYAIQTPRRGNYTWKWRVWIPEGHSYSIKLAGQLVPKQGFPKATGTMDLSQPGEHWVEYRIAKDASSGGWFGTLKTKMGSVGGGPHEWPDWPQRTSAGDGVDASTVSADPAKPLVLSRERYSQVDSSTQIEDPAPGFMIWLDPHP